MSYFLSAFVQSVGQANIDVHTNHEHTSDEAWRGFNAGVRALGQHGRVTEVRKAGEWNDRFDIVRGLISGVQITLYGPRYVDERPSPLPTPISQADSSERDLVRQLQRELQEQA